MTIQQIKETQPADISTNSWLKEIALQLALLNEKQPRMIEQMTTSQAFRVEPQRQRQAK